MQSIEPDFAISDALGLLDYREAKRSSKTKPARARRHIEPLHLTIIAIKHPYADATDRRSTLIAGKQQFALGWRVFAGQRGQFGVEMLIDGSISSELAYASNRAAAALTDCLDRTGSMVKGKLDMQFRGPALITTNHSLMHCSAVIDHNVFGQVGR